jgi:hypothetical protein
VSLDHCWRLASTDAEGCLCVCRTLIFLHPTGAGAREVVEVLDIAHKVKARASSDQKSNSKLKEKEKK